MKLSLYAYRERERRQLTLLLKGQAQQGESAGANLVTYQWIDLLLCVGMWINLFLYCDQVEELSFEDTQPSGPA